MRNNPRSNESIGDRSIHLPFHGELKSRGRFGGKNLEIITEIPRIALLQVRQAKGDMMARDCFE